ncbi:MAG: methionyl-tRNA formyltransferase [Betaproteobacteria bacterium]|nr:methionyl-tRNA formyltransferase [Betaproteobacteria bacterium]
MKLVFAGTPRFAAEALAGILTTRHEVVLVLTQPDRPAGRGMRLAASDVKKLALEKGLRVEQPATLKDAGVPDMLRATGADVMVVAAYGLILPAKVLNAFDRGCLNIHASLLPRWRGAAPIQRAILAGDEQSGVCIMRMETGLDTGPVLLSEALTIDSRETAGSLHDKLAFLGARLIAEALDLLEQGTLRDMVQDHDAATYAAKIRKEDAFLDFSLPALDLDRRVRAFDPVPGCQVVVCGEPVKIWRAHVSQERTTAVPGTVVNVSERGIGIACGAGTILMAEELQRSGSRRIDAGAFLRGLPVVAGDRFESPRRSGNA